MTTVFRSTELKVEEAWLDYNGHMNMAYYGVLFDRTSDQFFDHLGIGADYARTRRLTIYTAEIHLSYVRELHLGDSVFGTLQLIDADEKRLHVYQELIHRDGWLSAACEVLSLHVDMEGPRVAPFPPDRWVEIQAIRDLHAGLSRPDRVGRSIAIKRKA